MDEGANIKAAEMAEEERFKQKFPGKKPVRTDFLNKRLHKGQVKYFDSGDYNMAKSGKKTTGIPTVGKAIPTSENLTQRKISTSSKSSLVEPHILAAALHNQAKLKEQSETDTKGTDVKE